MHAATTQALTVAFHKTSYLFGKNIHKTTRGGMKIVAGRIMIINAERTPKITARV
jgi:hypothetical protein